MLKDIFLPCIALVGLTSMTWLVAVYARIAETRKRKLSAQSLATRREITKLLTNTNASDNLSNLFELPLLFYTLCVVLEVTQSVTALYISEAWIFVVLRYGHSLIQITYNRVLHRFFFWFTSTLCLFVMWGQFSIGRILN